jgi:ribosomal protein L40E
MLVPGEHQPDRFQDASMSVAQCRFCDHVNPAGSKFCSECGGALHLLPCPRCGAVSQVTATVCYQCHAELPWHATATATSASPAAIVSKPPVRWRAAALVGTGVVAAVVALGYYGYRQPLPAEPAAAPAAADTASGSVVRATGVVTDPSPAVIDPAASGSALTQALSAVPANAPAKPSARSAQAANSPAAPAAAESNRAPPTLNPGSIAPPTPPRIESCTASIAALGLCTLEPGQGKVMETTVTGAGTAPVPALDGARRGGPDEIRQPCPEAQEALGLCTPRSSQGGN